MQLPNLKLELAAHEAAEAPMQCRIPFSADAVTEFLVKFIVTTD